MYPWCVPDRDSAFPDPAEQDQKTMAGKASFSPMVGETGSIAHTMSVPQQAQRLHSNLTGRPGHLPLTYTVELPHKHMEDLYAPLPGAGL